MRARAGARRRQRLLIGTPAYGGQVLVDYVDSLVHEIELLRRAGIDATVAFTRNVSLVQIARDQIATRACEEGFDRLAFIDGDISWTPGRLLHLFRRSVEVVAGTYPMKAFPPRLVFNPLPRHAQALGLEPPWSPDALEALARRFSRPDGLLEVRHVGTGILMIQTRLLRRMRGSLPRYLNQATRGLQEVLRPQAKPCGKEVTQFFPVGVFRRRLQSEDWGFCNLCHRHGARVYLDPAVVARHVGALCIDARSGCA
ncbi:MAG: hypothetical protein HY343_01175 [Lentisphaerae bacterium]|nr:hypothetical protein [Lentisphaerota bacterium]